MNRLPDNTPEILRRHGLKVKVVPGWKTRGRPASTGGFNPVGVLCHHTATTVAWTVAAVLRLLPAVQSLHAERQGEDRERSAARRIREPPRFRQGNPTSRPA